MPIPAPPGAPRGRALRPRVALGLAAGLALVAALLAYAGPDRVAAAIARADASLALAAVAAYAAFFAVRGLRWSLLLGPGAAGPGTAAAFTASGWLVSTLAPLKAGDVLRAAWMARRHGAGFGAVAGTVAIERTLDLLGLAVAASAALLAVQVAGLDVPAVFRDLVAIAWLLPLAAAAFLVALALVIPEPTGHHLAARVLRVVRQALDQLPSLARRPRTFLPVLVLSVAAVLAQCLVYTLLILALLPATSTAGDQAALIAAAGAPLFLLSFGLALTPGHLGTYEAAFVLVYASLGLAPAALLLPMALALHLLTASIVAVLGGLSFAAVGGAGRPRAGTSPTGDPSAEAPAP